MDPSNLVKGRQYILDQGTHKIEVTYYEHTLNYRMVMTSNNIRIPLSDSLVKTNLSEIT